MWSFVTKTKLRYCHIEGHDLAGLAELEIVATVIPGLASYFKGYDPNVHESGDLASTIYAHFTNSSCALNATYLPSRLVKRPIDISPMLARFVSTFKEDTSRTSSQPRWRHV